MEEVVEASYRLAEMVGTVRKMLWTGLLLAPFIFLITYFIWDRSSVGFVIGIVATVLFAIWHLLSYRDQCRRQIRRMMKKALGTDQPVPCEFELTGDHVIFRKQGTEFRFDWDRIVEVVDTDDAIELITEPAGIVRIPRRIFRDGEQLASWTAFIRDRTGDGPISPS
jgi:hypothetical protein